MVNDLKQNGQEQALAYLTKTKKRFRKEQNIQSIEGLDEIFDFVRFNHILKLDEQFSGLEEKYSEKKNKRIRDLKIIEEYEKLIESWHFNSNDIALYSELQTHSARRKHALLHLAGSFIALAVLSGMAGFIKQNILIQSVWSEYNWPNILQVWFLLILFLFVFLSLISNTIKTIH